MNLCEQLVIDLCLPGIAFSDGLHSSESLLVYDSWCSLALQKEVPMKLHL